MFFFSFLSSFRSFLTRQSLLDFIQGSHRVLNSWKSLEICSDLEQIWKIEIKSGKKLVNSLEVFFKLQKMLYKWIFLVLVKSYSIFPVCLQRTTKKALFLHFLNHLCEFSGTKERFCIGKESNSHRISLGHQHGRRFIVLGHQYGCHKVMWKHYVNYLFDNFGSGKSLELWIQNSVRTL